jgi:HEAT repeats
MRQHNRVRSAGCLVFALLFFEPASHSRISSIPSLAAMTKSASVIVVGEVVRVDKVGVGDLATSDGRHYAMNRMIATVRIDEVLKGDIASNIIRVEYLENPDWERGPLTNALAEKTYRVLFLTAEADRFGFAAPEQSSMPMSRNRNALPQELGADVYTQVLQHLAESLFSMEDTSQERVQAIFVLTNESSPLVTELFKRALADRSMASEPRLRLELLAAIVRRKDTSVLPDLTAELFASQDPQYRNDRVNMILALQQIDGVVAAPILIRALKLPESELRATAAEALKQFPSDTAIDALLDALPDSDPNAEFQVMEALSHLAKQPDWLPTSTTPDASWNAALDHWKDFAAARKSQLN